MATTIVTKSGSGAPTASNLVAGELAVDLTNKRLYTENSSGTVLELGTNPASDVTFGDNTKAVFGDGSDLRIYHTGSHSTIENIGTGHLQIHTTDFRLRNSAGTESMILANADGNVQLYYDNAEKLATTATGIDVTGSVTASAGITATTGTFSGNVASSSGMSITKTGVSAIAYDTKTGTNASSAAVTWYDGVNVFATDGSYEIKGTTGNGLTLAPTTGAATFSGTVTANGAAATAGLAVASDGSALNTIQVQDTRALAANVGGAFVFQAVQDGAGTLGTTAAIVSGRLNATSGNTQGYLTFLTGQSGGLTEGMRIDASGNLLVGTTNSANLASATPNVVTDESFGINDGTNIAAIGVDRINFNAGQYYVLNETNDGVKLVNGATSWTSQSDENSKENIVELSSALTAVKAMRCVRYNLKSQNPDDVKIGFIAQDWQSSYPEVVATDTDGTLGMNYTETIPVLLKAIQEQQAIIEALTARIAALES